MHLKSTVNTNLFGYFTYMQCICLVIHKGRDEYEGLKEPLPARLYLNFKGNRSFILYQRISKSS